MRFRNLRIWLRWIVYLIQARRWLRHGNADRIAADAMWHLNHVARRKCNGARYIYALKNLLVQHLYESGFCVAVDRQRQYARCWNCGGSGEHWTGGMCFKCDGTGIYRTHILYRFVFVVAGRRYVWHQPAALVKFALWFTSSDWGEYKAESGRGGQELEPEIVELYYVTLREYLRQRGRLENLYTDLRPRLGKCIRDDWRAWLRTQKWYHQWCTYRRRVGALVDWIQRYLNTGQADVPVGFVEESEIPF